MRDGWVERLAEVFGQDLHVRELPAREPITAPLPEWLDSRITDALGRQGITGLWPHQREALDAFASGDNIVVATGTASGKSLCYQVPIAQRLTADPRARALYIAPTKALAHDQLRAMTELGVRELVPSTYDGDSDQVERRFAREAANVIITNPDMLHHALLPGHERWQSLLRNLSVIAVDECHLYRGMFGAHVANVLRRLMRIAAHHGATPQVIMASATVGQPADHARMLTGVDFTAVDRDLSPRGRKTVAMVLPQPTLGTDIEGTVLRRSAVAEASDALSDMVADGVRTLVFVRSRKSAETVAMIAREHLADVDPSLPSTVTSYRAGYLPEERRDIEARLRDGTLLGVATTNALELGVDISGLDATVLAGWPGSLASFWQQVGRAGRGQQDAYSLMIASDNPLDHFLVNHPESVFDKPVEAAVCNPANANVLYGHLACAAAEAHLTLKDLPTFGDPAQTAPVLDALVADGLLRQRPTGWFWNGTGRVSDLVDIRGGGMPPYQIVVGDTGQLLGTIDADAALRQVHPGAVYVHLGETFLVDDLDLEHATALVEPADVDYSTYSRSLTSVEVVAQEDSTAWGRITVARGMLDVTDRVVGYQRRRNLTAQIIADVPLDLPPVTLRTQGIWLTIPLEVMNELHIGDIAGCVHAAEHAAIGLLPLVSLCDRNDIGGASLVEHPDTGLPTIFIYDGYSGGAGFTHHGYEVAREWLSATLIAITDCECAEGCPACVQSPKCGNNNSPLDKEAARRLLDYALSQAPAAD